MMLGLNTIQIIGGAMTFIIIIILSNKVNVDRKITSKNSTTNKSSKKVVENSAKILNNSFMYGVYFITFLILSILLMLSFSAFSEYSSFIDYWPFLFLVCILLFSSLIIERVKIKSKRTIQKDMRKI